MLIGELNELFTAFDTIVERNGCERIKTIGDAYLCVCGMSEENERHADCILQTSLEIRDFVARYDGPGKGRWRIRLGVHSGRVVGGVVGVRK